MTAPEASRPPAWSRRRVLRVIAPVPLLAASAAGCDGEGGTASTSAPTHRSPGSTTSARAGAPASAAPAGTPTAPATPEVSRAANVTDAVALTFHGDGPPQLAEALLSEAEKAGARLTVLAVGQWLAKYPQMAHRVLSGGHELGNHTEHHLAIDRVSEQLAYSEIEVCAQRLEKLTGSRGRWFRQSQGRLPSATVRAAATRAGYGTLLSYDLDSLDYRNPGANAITRNVLGAIRAGDVVSLHLGHPQTVAALPAILAGLTRRGLRAVTASELFPLDAGAGAGAEKGSGNGAAAGADASPPADAAGPAAPSSTSANQ